MMKEIKLYRGEIAIVDDEWYPVLSKWKWHRSTKGYAQRSLRPGKSIFMHQIIAMTPFGLYTDHINGNKLDNREANLRLCTNAENCRSQKRPHKDGSSGFKGVSPHQGKWQASITVNYKKKYLGLFKTAEEAARAYDQAAKLQHRSFACLNFPEDT